jgi:hypothetical protein
LLARNPVSWRERPHRRLPLGLAASDARGDHTAFGGEAVLGEVLAVVLALRPIL